MLRLRAAAWEDGYAVVEDGGSLFIIRPPYPGSRASACPASEADPASAVAKHGFGVAEDSFDDWPTLIEHLKRCFLEERRERVHDSARIKRLVERAPPDMVAWYLNRIEAELLPERQWRAAIDVLAHVLRNPAVSHDATLLGRIRALLEQAEQGRDTAAPLTPPSRTA
jgi:hypothetical protein